MKFVRLFAVLMVLSSQTPVDAMYAQPEMVPVDRLIRTGEEALRAHPNSVEAIYMLARTHYLAFACGAKQLDAYRDANDGLFTVGPFVHFPEPAASQIMNEARRRALAEMNIELGSIPTLETPMGGEYGKRLQEIKNSWRSQIGGRRVCLRAPRSITLRRRPAILRRPSDWHLTTACIIWGTLPCSKRLINGSNSIRTQRCQRWWVKSHPLPFAVSIAEPGRWRFLLI